MNANATLYFLCGKMAAGKSTLAKELAESKNAILIAQDDFLACLFPGEVIDIPSFVKYSARVREVLTPHIVALLSRGISVVLDFPANTRIQRSWFRQLFAKAQVNHELHFVDATDDKCKDQLKQRSKSLAGGSPFTTDAEFDEITKFFQVPLREEGFNVIRHERA